MTVEYSVVVFVNNVLCGVIGEDGSYGKVFLSIESVQIIFVIVASEDGIVDACTLNINLAVNVRIYILKSCNGCPHVCKLLGVFVCSLG